MRIAKNNLMRTFTNLSLIVVGGIFYVFPVFSDDFNKLLTVGSAIEISSKGEPLLKAGEFTVPEGQQAVNLKFNYIDPISGKKSTKLLASNIYDLSNKKQVAIEGEVKIIPAGIYQLRISGSIGACASLVYDIEPVPHPHKK